MQLTLAAGVLCNDGEATLDATGTLETIGDPTETALLVAAHEAGIDVVALRAGVRRGSASGPSTRSASA